MTKHDKAQILMQLDSKFTNNLEECLEAEQGEFFRIELKARALSILGQIVSEVTGSLMPHQREMLPIFDEVFSDIIVSVYLSGCSLDNPAQVVLRRSLELGIATVYLWDQPYQFWGWKNHDCDLNYNDMLEFLSKDIYKTFLKTLNENYQDDEIIDLRSARKLYRLLSNTTHGKITTFETPLPTRFSFSQDDWKGHLSLVDEVIKVLLDLWKKRFYYALPELKVRYSAMSRGY